MFTNSNCSSRFNHNIFLIWSLCLIFHAKHQTIHGIATASLKWKFCLIEIVSFPKNCKVHWFKFSVFISPFLMAKFQHWLRSLVSDGLRPEFLWCWSQSIFQRVIWQTLSPLFYFAYAKYEWFETPGTCRTLNILFFRAFVCHFLSLEVGIRF